MHEYIPVNDAGAKVLVSDSNHVTTTYLGLSEGTEHVLIEIKGSEALIALARVLLDQAAAVVRNEQAAATIAAGRGRFADV
jgi:hypothetical protein